MNMRNDKCGAMLPCKHRCQDKDYWFQDKDCRPCSFEVTANKSCGKHSDTLQCSQKKAYEASPCDICTEKESQPTVGLCPKRTGCAHSCVLGVKHNYEGLPVCACDTSNSPRSVSQQLKMSPVIPESPSVKLRTRTLLRVQLEYYFSPGNLLNDKFLVSQMDSDQYVDISMLANFKVIQELTNDLDLITDVLKKSNQVQVHSDGKRVRPIPTDASYFDICKKERTKTKVTVAVHPKMLACAHSCVLGHIHEGYPRCACDSFNCPQSALNQLKSKSQEIETLKLDLKERENILKALEATTAKQTTEINNFTEFATMMKIKNDKRKERYKMKYLNELASLQAVSKKYDESIKAMKLELQTLQAESLAESKNCKQPKKYESIKQKLQAMLDQLMDISMDFED